MSSPIDSTARFRIAKSDIVGHFDSLGETLLRQSDIESIVREQRNFWRLGESTTVRQFIAWLLADTPLRATRFEFPSRAVIRYVWGDVPFYKLASSLNANAYLSHFAALHIHGLTDQIPKTVYLNAEQTPKPKPASGLAQERIDAAFKRAPRTSNNVAVYEDRRICLLSGKNTGELGVDNVEGPQGETLRVTGIERTLIDITVRPYYAGGVFEVLEAYRRAADRISINKLTAMLKKIDYVYPYHQAVGFYLERCGAYRDSQIRLLHKIEMHYDFYLTYQMKNPDYSKDWRLFFPKGF